MYKNIGQKIKDLAIGIFLLGAVGAVIGGVAVMAEDEDFIMLGLLIILAGPFVAYCFSLLVYGFGELIEKTSEVAENTQNHLRNAKKEANPSKKKNAVQAFAKSGQEAPKPEESSADGVTDQDFLDVICPNCGKEISFLKGETDVVCPWCDTPLELR